MFQECMSSLPEPCGDCGTREWKRKDCSGGASICLSARSDASDPAPEAPTVTQYSHDVAVPKEVGYTGYGCDARTQEDALATVGEDDLAKEKTAVQDFTGSSGDETVAVKADLAGEVGAQTISKISGPSGDSYPQVVTGSPPGLESEDTDARREGCGVQDKPFCWCCCTQPDQKPDDSELLRKGWWCLYCCCAGCGVGPVAHFTHAVKCICCRQSCEATSCLSAEGCSGCVYSCCCCHSLCALPSHSEAPRCMCCNEICCGVKRHEQDDDEQDGGKTLQVYDTVLREAYMLCYCFCAGLAVSSRSIGHCCGAFCKCLCCRCQLESGSPADDDGICMHLLTCCCLFAQCRLPPNWDANPCCALCGCRWRKHSYEYGTQSGSHLNGVAPKQQEMV